MWLPLTGLIVTLALGIAAFGAERSHRDAAERVLRDYAGVAGSEFVRRTAFDVGFNGYQVVGPALRRGAPLPEMVRPLVGGMVSLTAEEVAALPEDREPFVVQHRVEDGRARTRVVVPPDAAFDVNLAALRAYGLHSLERGPLLPDMIGDGRLGNEILSLAFIDHAGGEILRAGDGRWPEWEVEVPFGDFYRGVLLGSRVRVAIDPAAAARLLPGGLPSTQLPALVVLCAAALALSLLAVRQRRREQAFVRMREDFVVSVSHELRTPLAQISLFTETVLLGRCRSDEERRRFLEAAARETLRLGYLVSNILDFSRAERRRLELVAAPRALAPLIGQVLQTFQPLAATRRVQLEAELDGDAAAAVDDQGFTRMLVNLLDNAVKYGPHDSEVLVSLGRAGARVELAVADRGPGVPPASRDAIFQPFHRLDRDRRSATPGAGIGLAIVRELAQRHGGSCRVEDRPGGGARFVVSLPGRAA